MSHKATTRIDEGASRPKNREPLISFRFNLASLFRLSVQLVNNIGRIHLTIRLIIRLIVHRRTHMQHKQQHP